MGSHLLDPLLNLCGENLNLNHIHIYFIPIVHNCNTQCFRQKYNTQRFTCTKYNTKKHISHVTVNYTVMLYCLFVELWKSLCRGIGCATFSSFVRVHLIHGLLFRRCGQTCLALQATLGIVWLSSRFCAKVSKKKKKERENAGGGVSMSVGVCVLSGWLVVACHQTIKCQVVSVGSPMRVWWVPPLPVPSPPGSHFTGGRAH